MPPMPPVYRIPRLRPRSMLPIFAVIALALSALVRPPAASADFNDYEREAIRIVNQERSARGLAALGTDIRLFEASEKHAEWMCASRTLSHYGPGGSTPGSRATAEGYVWTAIGETLAQGYTTPTRVVLDGWRRSAGHWSILMSSRYRDIGAAYVRCSGTRQHYWGLLVGNSPYPARPIEGGGDPEPSSTPSPTATLRPSATPRPSPSPTAPPVGGGTGGLRGTVELSGLPAGSYGGSEILVDGAKRGETDSLGRFSIGGVAAGRRMLAARRQGAVGAQTFVDVRPGSTRDVGKTRLLLGDITGDDKIDYADYTALVRSWYRCVGQSGYDPRADLNGDECATYPDYYLLRPNYGKRGPTVW